MTLVLTSPPQAAATTRAVLRMIEAGSEVRCAHCSQMVKFAARARLRQVIANVYVDGRWDCVQHFHAECYDHAGKPFGEVSVGSPSGAGRIPK